MIPEIGVMIGLYIVTRMLVLVCRSGERGEGALVKVAATVTIIVAVITAGDLFYRGTGLDSPPARTIPAYEEQPYKPPFKQELKGRYVIRKDGKMIYIPPEKEEKEDGLQD